MNLLLVHPTNYDDAPNKIITRILEVIRKKNSQYDNMPTYPIEWIKMGTIVSINALL
jgi:N-methylhydantoinase A/oxoprolinase/acetone carboxylase beta subunit